MDGREKWVLCLLGNICFPKDDAAGMVDLVNGLGRIPVEVKS